MEQGKDERKGRVGCKGPDSCQGSELFPVSNGKL